MLLETYQTKVPKRKLNRAKSAKFFFGVFPDRGKTDQEKANPAQIGSKMIELQA